MQNRYYYNPNGEKSLEAAATDYLQMKKKDRNLQFVVLADRSFLFDKSFRTRYDSLFGVLKSNNINPSNIEFAIAEEQRRFNASEWAQFREIGKFFNRQGVNFGFEDMYKVWSIQEVETANRKIVETADEIRKLNLSPYEKLLMAYLKVTSRKYTLEEGNEHYTKSRSVFGVLNSNRIVCVGYAELLKAIAEEIGDENIQIYENRVACSSGGKVIDGYHANLIIHIKDEKYGIDGFYYLDPTWDSGHENKNTPQISYFMVPLSDIDKIKYQIRGEWTGLPEGEIMREIRAAKKGNSSVSIYNGKMKKYISFTRDGFQLTQEFLQNCMAMYPELANVIKDEVIAEQYLRDIEWVETHKKKQEEYKQILDILSQSGIGPVSREDFERFEWMLGDLDLDLDALIEWIIQIQNKQSANSLEGMIAKMKGMVQSRISYEDIQHSKSALNREGYEKWIEEKVKYYQSVLHQSEEETKEMLLEAFPYEKYIKSQKSIIDEEQSEIDRRQKQFLEFEEKLKTAFSKNPTLEDKLRSMDDSDKSYIYYYVYDIFNNNIDEVVQKIVIGIEKFTTYSVVDFLNKKIEKEEKFELTAIEDQQMLDKRTIEKCVKTFIRGCKKTPGQTQFVDKWFKGHSSPIDLNKTVVALRVVLKKSHKELSQQDIYDYIHGIVDNACENILYKYNETASNALVQHAIQLREERELTT